MKHLNISTRPKEERIEFARKGGLSKRTPQVTIAWSEVEEIKELSKTMSHRKLAKKYKVSHATIFRIINS